jgi:general secretion pathway protein C
MLMRNASSSWLPKVVTFALSAVAAASAGYWGLKEWRIPAPLDVSAALLKPTPVTTGMVARALGGGMPLATGSTAASPSTRYALVGIVANRSGGGIALISVDGKAAKPVRVGAFIDNRLMLQSVEGRRALLAGGVDRPTEVTLELSKPLK